MAERTMRDIEAAVAERAQQVIEETRDDLSAAASRLSELVGTPIFGAQIVQEIREIHAGICELAEQLEATRGSVRDRFSRPTVESKA